MRRGWVLKGAGGSNVIPIAGRRRQSDWLEPAGADWSGQVSLSGDHWRLELRYPDAPPLPNQAKRWAAQVLLQRHSSSPPDPDALPASFKPVLDGLVDAGVLVDDSAAVIGKPRYEWVRVKPRYLAMRLVVEGELP